MKILLIGGIFLMVPSLIGNAMMGNILPTVITGAMIVWTSKIAWPDSPVDEND